MNAKLSSKSVEQLKHDRLSALAVGIMTLLALVLGAVLKSSVENRSQHIERKGITASVPANWVIKESAGNLIFVSWDPFVPDVRYSVSLESNDGDPALAKVAAQRNTILGKVLEAFRILDETSIIRRNREGYKVTYAFVDTKVSGLPLVLQGVDYYFPVGDKTMVITLQAQQHKYEDALLQFEAFLDSVVYKSGE